MSLQESKFSSQAPETNSTARKISRGIETKANKLAASSAIILSAFTLSACASEAPQNQSTSTSIETTTPSPSTAISSETPGEITESPISSSSSSELSAEPSSPETSSADLENNMGGHENHPAITPENIEERIAEMQITDDMTSEEKIKKFSETFNGWEFAGATPEAAHFMRTNFSISLEEYALDVASKNTKAYATALFGEDYESITDTTLISLIEEKELHNAANINKFLVTYSDKEIPNTNSKNEEAYRYEIEMLDYNIQGDSDVHLRLFLDEKTTNNADKTDYREIITWKDMIVRSSFTMERSKNDIWVVTGLGQQRIG